MTFGTVVSEERSSHKGLLEALCMFFQQYLLKKYREGQVATLNATKLRQVEEEEQRRIVLESNCY